MNLLDSIARRYQELNPKYISWDFYKKYIDVEPPFGQLGLPVFLRTYSRHIDGEKRREKWCECVLRNVEFSIGLDKVSAYDDLKKEAEELFDYMFNLHTFPSGRALWTAGTKQTESDPSSIWNCTFRTIDSISAYGEIFYWLLIGAGCGFSVEKEFTSKLPNFYNNAENKKFVYHFNMEPKKWNPMDHTTVIFSNPHKDIESVFAFDDEKSLIGNDDVYFDLVTERSIAEFNKVEIIVGDSKEGWVVALRLYLTLLTVKQRLNIQFNYERVRPAGMPLKRFGGLSTGCKNFVRMIDQINLVLSDIDGKLNTSQAMDIVGIVALCVVSGNIRRSALIALGEPTDSLFKDAKFNLWTDDEKAPYRAFRVMSNNSIVVDEKLTREELEEVFEKIKSNGEPGLYIRGNARKYDDQITGTNPCVEASLRNKQSCNLTTNNVVKAISYDKLNQAYLDIEKWEKSLYLSTRIGSRVTTLPQWHPEWNSVQESQRLLGVSMTGLMDAVDILGWNEEKLQDFLVRSRLYVREVADKYHAHLGIERSARVSLTKPEGSLSQLPTVSSGVHRGYAPNYMRRVRFSSIDPLAKALLDVVGEDNVNPENGQGENLYADGVDTWVFTFPIQTNAETRAIDEPAVKQLERYKMVQNAYTADGHNTSITVTVSPEEWDEVVEWVYENWDSVIGVSFLPKYDPELVTYPQMPYEPCTKEICESLKEKIPSFTENQLITLISKYEDKYEEYDILEDACSTGACPLR